MSTHISVLSYKLFPPQSSASCESLLTTIDQLAPTNPDYVSVTCSGDRARKQKTLALLDHLVHETRLTPLAHLTCVGHTAEELEAAVRRILAIGVRGFLAPACGMSTPRVCPRSTRSRSCWLLPKSISPPVSSGLTPTTV